jgi:hypothetical protein
MTIPYPERENGVASTALTMTCCGSSTKPRPVSGILTSQSARMRNPAQSVETFWQRVVALDRVFSHQGQVRMFDLFSRLPT